MENNLGEIPEKIFSVSEYIEFLNLGLEKFSGKIIGEVGRVETGPTGHIYFSLRDEKDQSVISCIIWKSKYSLYGIELKEGLKIIATGSPSVYPQTGRLSFIADVIEPAGEGELKKQYEALKKKLSEEGLFAEEKKRPLPPYPQKIGVITSKQGAVLADFLNNLGRFGFKIKMIDSRVEGQEAVADLLSAIKTFKKQDIEVLAIMRGGGPMESMIAFNNELLAREVADFPVPVIAGIGHHKDEPLAALAADVSVSTPTAAANLLSESWNQALLLVERRERDIIGRYEEILASWRDMENRLKSSLVNFKNYLLNARIVLRDYLVKSLSGFKTLLLRASQNLAYVEKAVAFNSPERQLRLGYSIASCRGRIIRKTADAKIGEDVDIRLTDGVIVSEVKKIHPVK